MDKVCRSCGTLNDARNNLCIRCGESLEIDENKIYQNFHIKAISNKVLFIVFALIFTIFWYALIFYACPWLNGLLVGYVKDFIFKALNNRMVTNLILYGVYTLSLYIVNYIVIMITLDSILNRKVIKKETINALSLLIFTYMFASVTIMTLINFKSYIFVLAHLIVLLFMLPNIKIKLVKKTI